MTGPFADRGQASAAAAVLYDGPPGKPGAAGEAVLRRALDGARVAVGAFDAEVIGHTAAGLGWALAGAERDDGPP